MQGAEDEQRTEQVETVESKKRGGRKKSKESKSKAIETERCLDAVR